ncbi:hypothetical protein GobsT_12290 [Gemmata obscuriglobus]|uniref:Uncharacterized protein n=1 Tax=Gemmata obscuriglobus TaxID=114 RepID=A0A2Z3H7E2_9BACT|nr:hypothetical protein C1280_27065 [Gemmata obscuriglobus]QEG26489.1 hypothetical protein GobsT_12290 [Gemmata obscuriglobus]VTS01755.1 unnamed protein product [Gemmata obscuriglobus UQM 2246]
MRTCLFVLSLALLTSGCKPKSAPTPPPAVAQQQPEHDPRSAPAPHVAPGDKPEKSEKPKKDDKPDLGLPWSEGTANKKLIGLTDDEVKALIGKPDHVSPSSDLQFTEWRYTQNKWLSPPEGSTDLRPTGFVLCMRGGKARQIYRLPPY